MEEFLLGENYALATNAIKILLPGRILAGIPEKSFSLGGIPESTDFSARFLPRYAAGIFPGKDPAGKTGHLGGIPVSAGNLVGIPARSRYLFYKDGRYIFVAVYVLLYSHRCKNLTLHVRFSCTLILILFHLRQFS